MEYLSGQDLEKYYKSISYQFEEKKLKEIIYQVIDGLEAMHSVKILHRDIKPQNIFLTDEGTIKLLDFGLVKMIDYTTLTMKGDGPKGTPLYIPPEAIRGEKLDSRSDFYSLGVMIYYIVTNGNFPFDAANILQLINMVLNQPPRPPKSFNKKISNEFENLILMMLSKQPFERNITHKDLKEAIRNTPIKLESQVKPIKKPVFKKEVWFRLLPNEKSKILQFLDNGGRINGIEYVANYLPRNRKTIAEILQRKTKFFFDPATNRLPYSTFSQTKGLVDLPYCWDKLNRLTHEDLRNISDIQKYVREVINWQASWNCDFFVAPFHFHRNLGDPWLELDLKLLQESVDYVKNNYSDIKIYAGICLNLEEYTSENNRRCPGSVCA